MVSILELSAESGQHLFNLSKKVEEEEHDDAFICMRL
jgi:hypothetical protein